MNRQELEVAALNDFKIFAKLAWEHLRLPDPSELQYEIADFLQEGHSCQVLQALYAPVNQVLPAPRRAWRT